MPETPAKPKSVPRSSSSKSTIVKLLELFSDPFIILRDLKEYRALLKPTPGQFFFLLAVATFVYLLALLLDLAFGIGVVLNPIMDWALMTPFMFWAFWFFGASYSTDKNVGSKDIKAQGSDLITRVVTNLVTDVLNTFTAEAFPTWIANVIISTGVNWSKIVVNKALEGKEGTIGGALEKIRREKAEAKARGEKYTRRVPPPEPQEESEQEEASAGDGVRLQPQPLYSLQSSYVTGVKYGKEGKQVIQEEKVSK